MDIERLYELAEKSLPDTILKADTDKVGTCPHHKSRGGDRVFDCNHLNIKEIKGLSPVSPLVPSVLTNPVNLNRARVGGGEISSCAEIREKGIGLLSKAASEVNHPLDDLLDWYAIDLDIISELPLYTVRVFVNDYVIRREWYREVVNNEV